MSDGDSASDSKNITKILERNSTPPPEKIIKFLDNQNAGWREMFPSYCAFDVYSDAQFTDSSQSALSKKDRQRRYREQHREELKQREAERRKSKQNVLFQSTTSCSNFNSTEQAPHKEHSSENVHMKSARKKERQRKYRELHREQLKQREAERRKSQKNVQQREYDSEEAERMLQLLCPIVTLIPSIVPLEASTATITEITDEATDNIE